MSVFTWMVIIILAAALLLQGNVKGSKKFIIVAFLILFCVMGLRNVHYVGNDSSIKTGSYHSSFLRIGNASWDEILNRDENSENNENSENSEKDNYYNIGFRVLTKLIYEVTDGDFQTYITLLSMFIIFAYAIFVGKYSPSPIQSVLYFLGLLYFTFLFDALKQAMAMSTLLFSFNAIIEKKPIKFIFIVLIAATFHFPALIFLPAYWIGRMKIGRSYLILLAVLLVLTYVFRDKMLNIMLGAYGGEGIEGSMTGVRFLRNKAIIMIIVVIAAVILRPPTKGDTVYNACLAFAGIAIVFQTFCGYNNIFERLADYYFHTSIVFIPLVFEKIELKKRKDDSRALLRVKQTAPTVFCSFAVWRFLSFVNNSPVFAHFRFLWQG